LTCPYKGCHHHCAYCYAPNVLRITQDRWDTILEVKTNIPNILASELKRKKPGVVGLSTVTDPYQPLERKYHLTRFCLEQLYISCEKCAELLINFLDYSSKDKFTF
jgi:DNA repair photolyase